ncbi:MAG: gluconate 2-dehydrogenase subunit 3 family protein [Gemmatimonadales bacterium]
MSAPVLPPVHAAFRAIALTVVPEAASLEGAEWLAVEGIVESALALRPASVRRQLRLLIRVIDVLPLLRYGRRFTALDPASRLAFLSAMQRFPILLVRRGVWGLRTLVFMGYYARPEAGAAIGYRANARGWEARR